MKAKLSDTKGFKVRFQISDTNTPVFIAGGKKRVLVEEYLPGSGAVFVNGEIKTDDGNRYYAILELDECSGGEYYGGYYFEKNGNRIEVKEILGNVGPHKYKYHAITQGRDHHIGDDGWSIH